jgi:hypothetical protein
LVQIGKQSNLAQLAEVLMAAYGYADEEATAWRTFATYGYRSTVAAFPT